ncbi:MAG: sigma factor [Candidatus Eisenbacteria bacterium]
MSDDGRIAAWIAGARNEDPQATRALGEYVRTLAREVCRRSSASAMGSADWEDVAQEAAIRVFGTGLQRFQGTGSARGYLYSIVKASLLQTLRSERRRKAREMTAESSPAADWPSGSFGTDPARDAAAMLDRLDDGCRQLIENVFFHGVAYARLARERIWRKARFARVSRCLRTLRLASSERDDHE